MFINIPGVCVRRKREEEVRVCFGKRWIKIVVKGRVKN